MPEKFCDARDRSFEITLISAEEKAEGFGSELLAFSGVEIRTMQKLRNSSGNRPDAS